MRSRGPQFYDAGLSRRRSLPGWVKCRPHHNGVTSQRRLRVNLDCFRLATSPSFGPGTAERADAAHEQRERRVGQQMRTGPSVALHRCGTAGRTELSSSASPMRSLQKESNHAF